MGLIISILVFFAGIVLVRTFFNKKSKNKKLLKKLFSERRARVLKKIAALDCTSSIRDIARLREDYLKYTSERVDHEKVALDFAIQAHLLEKYSLFDKGIIEYIDVFEKDFFLKTEHLHEWAILEKVFREESTIESCFISKIKQELDSSTDCIETLEKSSIFLFFNRKNKKYNFLADVYAAAV